MEIKSGVNGPRQIATWVLLGVLMAAPLAFGAVQPWAWAAMTILISFLVLGWTIHRARTGMVKMVWSPLFVPLAVLLGLVGVQYLAGWTANAVDTREAAIKLSCYSLIFFITLQLFADMKGRVWNRAACAITAYGFAMALLAIIQFFTSPGLLYGFLKPRWGGYVFGPYVNHNHYAGLMEMLVPIAVGLVFTLRCQHPAKPLALFAVLTCIVSALLSGSRGGVIALLAEFTILAAVIFLARPVYQPLSRSLMAGLVVVMLAGASFFWLDAGGVWSRWKRLAESPEISDSDRARMAADTLHMARDHAFQGVGLGGFAVAYPAYQSVVTDDLVDYAHNDYAQFLAEGGVTAAILLLVTVPGFLWSSFRGLRGRLQHRAGWLQVGAAVGVCGLLVHSFVDFNLHIPANAAWFAFCAALALAPMKHSKPDTWQRAASPVRIPPL